MDSVPGTRMDCSRILPQSGIFRFRDGQTIPRFLRKLLIYYLISLLFFIPLTMVCVLAAGIAARMLWSVSVSSVTVLQISLVASTVIFVPFVISIFNRDYDLKFCRSCGRAWAGEMSVHSREEDTDEYGIPLLGGRRMRYGTTRHTCRYCGQAWEQTHSSVIDPDAEYCGE